MVRYIKDFISCTSAWATNEYADRHYLAYCLNVFLHPITSQFFINRGVDIDEEGYALSEMSNGYEVVELEMVMRYGFIFLVVEWEIYCWNTWDKFYNFYFLELIVKTWKFNGFR